MTILKEHEDGVSVSDLTRQHNVSEQSIYRWKSKFGGMDINDAKRLRQLEQENSSLKRPLADTELDKIILKEVIEKNCEAGRQKRVGRPRPKELRYQRQARRLPYAGKHQGHAVQASTTP